MAQELNGRDVAEIVGIFLRVQHLANGGDPAVPLGKSFTLGEVAVEAARAGSLTTLRHCVLSGLDLRQEGLRPPRPKGLVFHRDASLIEIALRNGHQDLAATIGAWAAEQRAAQPLRPERAEAAPLDRPEP